MIAHYHYARLKQYFYPMFNIDQTHIASLVIQPTFPTKWSETMHGTPLNANREFYVVTVSADIRPVVIAILESAAPEGSPMARKLAGVSEQLRHYAESSV